MPAVLYAAKPETRVYKAATGKAVANVVLMGTWLGVLEETETRVRVSTAGPDGWVEKADTVSSPAMKVFFIDVGQGDAVLIEAAGKRVVVDGGPGDNLLRYLKGWQYRYLIEQNERVHFDAIIVSHFDADHYNGITDVLEDRSFSVGCLYHNGIARFSSRATERPEGYNTDLGRTEGSGSGTRLETVFSTIAHARSLLKTGGLQSAFRRLLNAAVNAHDDERLGEMRRVTVHDAHVPGFGPDDMLSLDVLGPVPVSKHPVRYQWLGDSSHTRNGHSVVLKARYGQRSILLGGDLNTKSEGLLMEYHSAPGVFEVDVAKSCHHGSSDFSVAFMNALNPLATVISSGDNESYSHPRADAIGCAGRYSRGQRPLVFSTELARSVRAGGDILYGMINLRTDGTTLLLAQMKENHKGADIWDSYELP